MGKVGRLDTTAMPSPARIRQGDAAHILVALRQQPFPGGYRSVRPHRPASPTHLRLLQ